MVTHGVEIGTAARQSHISVKTLDQGRASKNVRAQGKGEVGCNDYLDVRRGLCWRGGWNYGALPAKSRNELASSTTSIGPQWRGLPQKYNSYI